jgi:hypothetical protein
VITILISVNRQLRRRIPPSRGGGETCDGKVKDIYKSKELWRGPESIYRKEVVLALSGDKTANGEGR